MYGEVYLYRTRKPGAILGLPFFGRHNGYVGQTRNPKRRHGEHINGGGRYGQEAKPWADLSPKRYVIFSMRHCPQWLLNLVERLAIWILLPAYNIMHNRANPRRIKPWTAKRQRALRDLSGWSFNITAGHLVGAGLVIALIVGMVAR